MNISILATEKIQKHGDEESWQIDAIKKSIEEADKGKFATVKEMKEFFARWKVNAD